MIAIGPPSDTSPGRSRGRFASATAFLKLASAFDVTVAYAPMCLSPAAAAVCSGDEKCASTSRSLSHWKWRSLRPAAVAAVSARARRAKSVGADAGRSAAMAAEVGD